MTAMHPVGTRIWFEGFKRPFRIRARNERYAVLTQPFNPRRTVLYCIVDLVEQIRGPENLIFGRGAETDIQCRLMLRRIRRGETQISHRHRVPLVVTRIEPPRELHDTRAS